MQLRRVEMDQERPTASFLAAELPSWTQPKSTPQGDNRLRFEAASVKFEGFDFLSIETLLAGRIPHSITWCITGIETFLSDDKHRHQLLFPDNERNSRDE